MKKILVFDSKMYLAVFFRKMLKNKFEVYRFKDDLDSEVKYFEYIFIVVYKEIDLVAFLNFSKFDIEKVVFCIDSYEIFIEFSTKYKEYKIMFIGRLKNTIKNDLFKIINFNEKNNI